MAEIEFGLDTFGDVTVDAEGRPLPQAQVLRHVVAEGVLADQVGLDAFGVGEHHRADFAVSAPEVMLAAIAGQTRHIRLGSAVTVLSTDDPVRVFERFATLDAVSGGRAEVTVGRGSFTESYPLFGFDLSQYELLFEERLELFARLLEQQPVTWSGRTRAALEQVIVHPPIEGGRLRTWVGVGGSPESVVRAARYGLPLMLAIIGGHPARFSPYVALYHKALRQQGKAALPVGAHSPGHVAATDEQAREEVWPHYQAMMNRIGRERGWSPVGRDHFEREASPDGALFVGSPETVARKIVNTVRTLGLARFDLEVQQRHALARGTHDQHRALRHEGRTDGEDSPRELTAGEPVEPGPRAGCAAPGSSHRTSHVADFAAPAVSAGRRCLPAGRHAPDPVVAFWPDFGPKHGMCLARYMAWTPRPSCDVPRERSRDHRRRGRRREPAQRPNLIQADRGPTLDRPARRSPVDSAVGRARRRHVPRAVP